MHVVNKTIFFALKRIIAFLHTYTYNKDGSQYINIVLNFYVINDEEKRNF